jgi:hypothetical protein
MKESTDPATELNELGRSGWEFAGTVDYVGGGTKFLLMKRPVVREAHGDGHE